MTDRWVIVHLWPHHSCSASSWSSCSWMFSMSGRGPSGSSCEVTGSPPLLGPSAGADLSAASLVLRPSDSSGSFCRPMFFSALLRFGIKGVWFLFCHSFVVLGCSCWGCGWGIRPCRLLRLLLCLVFGKPAGEMRSASLWLTTFSQSFYQTFTQNSLELHRVLNSFLLLFVVFSFSSLGRKLFWPCLNESFCER